MALLCQDTQLPCHPERRKIWAIKDKFNPSSYHLTDAEGFNVCSIDNERRCGGSDLPHADHVFLTCLDTADEKKLAIIVELKGNDVTHGCEQIVATLNTMKPFLQRYLVLARLVTTRTPKVTRKASVRNTLISLLKAHAQSVSVKPREGTLFSGSYIDSLTQLRSELGL